MQGGRPFGVGETRLSAEKDINKTGTKRSKKGGDGERIFAITMAMEKVLGGRTSMKGGEKKAEGRLKGSGVQTL